MSDDLRPVREEISRLFVAAAVGAISLVFNNRSLQQAIQDAERAAVRKVQELLLRFIRRFEQPDATAVNQGEREGDTSSQTKETERSYHSQISLKGNAASPMPNDSNRRESSDDKVNDHPKDSGAPSICGHGKAKNDKIGSDANEVSIDQRKVEGKRSEFKPQGNIKQTVHAQDESSGGGVTAEKARSPIAQEPQVDGESSSMCKHDEQKKIGVKTSTITQNSQPQDRAGHMRKDCEARTERERKQGDGSSLVQQTEQRKLSERAMKETKGDPIYEKEYESSGSDESDKSRATGGSITAEHDDVDAQSKNKRMKKAAKSSQKNDNKKEDTTISSLATRCCFMFGVFVLLLAFSVVSTISSLDTQHYFMFSVIVLLLSCIYFNNFNR